LPNALIDEAPVIAHKVSEPNSRATGLISLARLNLSIRVRGISCWDRGRLMLGPSIRRIGASIFRLAFEVPLSQLSL
jgi:hypothetical protein